MKTVYKKSVVVCLLYFACFGVRAAEIPVNIYGLPNVTSIQNVIQTAISSAGIGDVVTVTNNDGSNDVPYNSANATLTLNFTVNVKVVWGLEYANASTFATTTATPLITLQGVGVFEVTSGGSVIHTNRGTALNITGAGITVTVDNGGIVSSDRNGGSGAGGYAILIAASNVAVNVNGGTVESKSNNTNAAIQVNNDMLNAVINVDNGGSVISYTNGNAINDGAGITTPNTSNTSIHVSGNSTVIAEGATSAIHATGAGVTVVVEDATVSSNSTAPVQAVIYVVGVDPSLNNGLNVIVKGNSKVLANADGGYAIMSSGDVEINGNAVISAQNGGVAIDAVGTNSTVTIYGGTVSTTGGLPSNAVGGSAISCYAKIVVNGGTVSATTGKAVHTINAGGTVEINGGVVMATTGYAIRNDNATSSIAVDGGFVFAYGTGITGGMSGTTITNNVTNRTPTVTNGVLVAWDQSTAGPNPTYYATSSTDLTQSPVSATTTWQKVGTANGIAYANGTNTGFFPLDVQIIYPIYPDANGIVYVDHTKSGDGSSWAQAYPNLADPLLQAAMSGALITQIWVAEGTYYPMHTADGYDLTGQVFDVSDAGRDNAFVLVPEVKIYGGFVPNDLPNSGAGVLQYAPAFGTTGRNGETILSGDIDGDGTMGGNAYHVVIGVGISLNSNTLVDGFTISGGNADGSSTITVNGETIESDFGGGMVHVYSSPTITHVTFSGNSAANRGGGLYLNHSSPMLFNGIISGNNVSGSVGGGGMYNDTSSPLLTNVTISGNNASSGNGGGMFNDNASPGIRNTIIWGNTAFTDDNVSDVNGSAPIYSYSLVGGSGISGGGNIDIDPEFLAPVASTLAPTTAGDYHLKPGSPAIEAGNNGLFLTARGILDFTDATDLAGNLRLSGVAIDMGAYETTVYLVEVESDGTGATGGGFYGEGDVINIDAGADPAGYRFVGWTTTSPGVVFALPGDRATSFVMPANSVAITAVFKELFTVTVVSAGLGSSGGGSYLPGEVVNIDAGADPDTDHQFLDWQTTSSGVVFALPSARATSFVMPANDVTVIAEFENLYVVIVSSVGTGAMGDGHYHEGEIVTIHAGTPPAGLEFSRWTTVPEVNLANANSVSTTFVMPANRVIVTAEFCAAGDKQAIEDAQRLFEETEWSVVEQVSYTSERLKTRLIEQINNLIDENSITVAYSDITISRIIPPVANTNGSFRFTVTLTKCSYIRVLNLTCVMTSTPYTRIVRLITIDGATNGRIVSDRLYAATNETVTLTILPDAGYQLDEITAFHTEYVITPVPLTGDGDIRTFLMPPHVVTVKATFTLATGIHTPQADIGLKAYAASGVLHVNGLTVGAGWNVYNIVGTLVYQGVASSDNADVALPGRGVYIVTDGKNVIKVNN